jgi:preprotein translocase subunit SecB
MKQQTDKTGGGIQHERAVPFFPIQLTDVRLKEIHAEVAEPEEDEQEATTRVSSTVEENPDPEGFFATLRLDTCRMAGEEEVLTLAVTVEGAFRAVGDLDEIDQEVAQEFMERDILLLLWPYLREEVHSLTRRMRLPVPPLPVVDVRTLVQAGEAGEPDSE